MDITALRYFMELARLGHMTRTAERLNITQPSLSASIKRLEAEIGFQLFDRTGGGIHLNEYGEIFLRGVATADESLTSSLAEMDERRRGEIRFVRLACSNSPVHARLIELLLSRGFNLMVDNIFKGWDVELLRGNCDLVVTMSKTHREGIESAALRMQRLMVVAGMGHPLSKRGDISMDDLRNHFFCSTGTYSLINILRDVHPAYDFSSRIAFMGRDSADMMKAIRSGQYIGLIADVNIPDFDDVHVLQVKDFAVSLPIYLYWRHNGEKNSSLPLIRNHIEQFYAELSGMHYEC